MNHVPACPRSLAAQSVMVSHRHETNLLSLSLPARWVSRVEWLCRGPPPRTSRGGEHAHVSRRAPTRGRAGAAFLLRGPAASRGQE